jgi:hypothetical protein
VEDPLHRKVERRRQRTRLGGWLLAAGRFDGDGRVVDDPPEALEDFFARFRGQAASVELRLRAALGITLIFVPAPSIVAETVVRNMAWISGSRLRISSAVREAVAGSSSFAISGGNQA